MDGVKVFIMQIVEVRFIISKFGKILLLKNNKDEFSELGKWILPGGPVTINENLKQAVSRIIKDSSGWKTKDIRLFKIASFNDDSGNILHEVVFIVEAVNKLADKEKPTRWFTLNDLPDDMEISKDHREIIKEYKELVHKGKTLDLERLPPIFDLKNVSMIKSQLLTSPE
jgi:ADP-ribose pyrophosphatase YjhB (NUDIX family)